MNKIANMFRITSDRREIININYIQYIDIQDENTILIKVAGKEQLIKQSLNESNKEEINKNKEIFEETIKWLCSEKIE